MIEAGSTQSSNTSVEMHDADGPPRASQAADAQPLPVAPIRVSVIIPALNEEKMIGICLTSLAESRFPKDAFEVVLVDNGSTDRTLEIARSFSSRLRITIRQFPGASISALRNVGVATAQAEILAFLDADCSILTDWFESAVLHLTPESAGVIGGNYDIPKDSSWVARVWYKVGYPPKDGEVTYVPAGNMLMRKSFFLQIGGFNEKIETSEDCELCSRAWGAGLSVREISAMAVTHWSTPQTLSEFYRKEAWHGRHVARVFFQNMRAMTNFRAVAFAVYMLGCVAGVLTGAVWALLFHQYLILAASVAGMFAGPLFCSISKMRCIHGKKFWLNLMPLTVMHMVWGFARARSLMPSRISHPRSSMLADVKAD